MRTWKEVEQAAIHEHTGKAGKNDFRNRLLGDNLTTYSIYHHYGLGKVKGLESILKKSSGDKIKKMIYHLEKEESRYLLSLLKGTINKNSKILDCGSGSGGTAFDLFDQYGCNVVGINITNKQVKFTNKLATLRKVSKKVKFRKMNMRQLTFKASSFDAAISNETDMYVDLDTFYNGLARVLKKGGTYAIISWCRTNKHATRNKYADKVDAHYIVKMQVESNYKKSLEKNGFKIINYQNLTKKAIDYWKLRAGSPISSNVDKPFLDGLERGYIKYFSIVAKKK